MAAYVVMSGTGDFELPARKKPKVSELPLSSAQRASIDGMLHTFKKKGEFDALRKKAFQQYNESAQRGMFEAALRTFTSNEIERDPIKYLKPDRRMGAPLLEGAAARGDVYKRTAADIDAYIDQYLASAEGALREIRRKDIGEEAAEEEMQRGCKSDEAYAAEADVRRADRAKQHVEQEKLRKKKEAQERKKKEFEALKKKQEELMKETERLQREQKRRAEREAWKAAEKQRERDRIQKFNEEREKQKKEVEEREKAAKEEKDRRAKERADREQKRLEQEALDLLLREGEKMAEKGKRPELERSESMEPPPRLLKHQSARNSLSRDEMRAQGLMPTSMTLRKGDKPISAPTGPRADSTPRGPAADEDRRARASRPSRRSPTPPRSSATSRRLRDPSPEDDRRAVRRDGSRRETLYRDISAEREAWKARQQQRQQPREAAGEEGEVVEGPPREPRGAARVARSRSRDTNAHSYRPARRGSRSRSPPRRRYRADSRSRSPPRYGRRRDDSPPRRRERTPDRRQRSRSPPGIDRYVPGGGGGAAAPVRRTVRDDDERPARRRDEDLAPRRRVDEDDRDDRRRRESRYDDRSKDTAIDRYIPGSSQRTEDSSDKPRARRERSQSRERVRERSREATKDRPQERERERERIPTGPRESPRESKKDGQVVQEVEKDEAKAG
ncbi:hypothetical protein LTR78_000535 [Recurvomyces mirabilis]|uniref:BOD1/SHG1 domain-containing protein n=1 Tax=Recurvomyces mirabilis TaxID=574656 RepID=A0AAE0WY36_9PEZI|nr:hypothetical protein LTR78_000535 [Recurvomyces mirabilis]KAK5162189.1 hypothetical protein LTS14_000535 [Recurvomyces mirabilis]